MHPLAAIGLVFLTGLAWMVTILTLLIALSKDRRRQTDASPASQGAAPGPSDLHTLRP